MTITLEKLSLPTEMEPTEKVLRRHKKLVNIGVAIAIFTLLAIWSAVILLYVVQCNHQLQVIKHFHIIFDNFPSITNFLGYRIGKRSESTESSSSFFDRRKGGKGKIFKSNFLKTVNKELNFKFLVRGKRQTPEEKSGVPVFDYAYEANLVKGRIARNHLSVYPTLMGEDGEELNQDKNLFTHQNQNSFQDFQDHNQLGILRDDTQLKYQSAYSRVDIFKKYSNFRTEF